MSATPTIRAASYVLFRHAVLGWAVMVCKTVGSAGGHRTRYVLQVSALRAVAASAKQLEVVDRRGAAQGHRQEVVILKIELLPHSAHWPPSRS